MLLSCAEGSLQVVVGVGLGELAEVHEIGPGQRHRAGRQQAGSKAGGQTGEKTSLSESHPGRGQEESNLAKGKALCAGACLFAM